MTSGQKVAADITVKNTSPVTWPSKPDSKGRYAVNLSYHWLDQKGEMVVFDGQRTPLPRDLKAGDSVDLKAAILAPAKPGRYTLEVTLVQESSAWFPDRDGKKLVVPVNVIAGNQPTQGGEPIQTTAREAVQENEAQPSAKTKAHREAKSAEKPAPWTGPSVPDSAKIDQYAHSSNGGAGPWSVQVGSYTEKKIAVDLAKKLQDKGYDAYVATANVKGKDWYRVRIGHLKGRALAEKLRDKLNSAEKFEHSIVTAR